MNIKILNISMFTFKFHIHFKDPSSVQSLEYETCQNIYIYKNTQPWGTPCLVHQILCYKGSSLSSRL